MDEKKVREAIEEFKSEKEAIENTWDYFLEEVKPSMEKRIELCNISIEALEKQLPKKPIEYEDKYYACPICGNVLMHKWEKYPTILADRKNGLPCCLSCLQVIDWSES